MLKKYCDDVTIWTYLPPPYVTIWNTQLEKLYICNLRCNKEFFFYLHHVWFKINKEARWNLGGFLLKAHDHLLVSLSHSTVISSTGKSSLKWLSPRELPFVQFGLLHLTILDI